MRGYQQSTDGKWHPIDVPDDYPGATHTAGAPARTQAPAKPGTHAPARKPTRPPHKPNKPTGRRTVTGVGHKRTRPGFKRKKVAFKAPPRKPVQPLHKAAMKAKHHGQARPPAPASQAPPGHVPQKTAHGPSIQQLLQHANSHTKTLLNAINAGAIVAQHPDGNIKIENATGHFAGQHWLINGHNGGGMTWGPLSGNKTEHRPAGTYQVSLILQASAAAGTTGTEARAS